jgi:hypothetical protein
MFTIVAGQHSKAIDRAAVTELMVEASFDDGQTWSAAPVVDGLRDTFDTGGFLPAAAPRQAFDVVLAIPPLAHTSGGTVDQTIQSAYIVTAGDPTRLRGSTGPAGASASQPIGLALRGAWSPRAAGNLCLPAPPEAFLSVHLHGADRQRPIAREVDRDANGRLLPASAPHQGVVGPMHVRGRWVASFDLGGHATVDL